MNSFTFNFPTWFCAIFSLVFIGVLFYIGALHHQIKAICKDHPRILTALIRISEILLQKKMSKELIFYQSPAKLTDEGVTAIKECGFQEFYEANKSYLLEKIRKDNPKTMADIEESCKNIMLQIEDPLPKFESIKQYAYNKGEPIARILFACAIALRDIVAREFNITA